MRQKSLIEHSSENNFLSQLTNGMKNGVMALIIKFTRHGSSQKQILREADYRPSQR